jgi:hypothetical protein
MEKDETPLLKKGVFTSPNMRLHNLDLKNHLGGKISVKGVKIK